MHQAYRLATRLIALVLIFSTAAPAFSQQVLPVRLISVTSPARHGYDATIVVATAPKAACTIAVYYKSRSQSRTRTGPRNGRRTGQSGLGMARRDADDARHMANHCKLLSRKQTGKA